MKIMTVSDLIADLERDGRRDSEIGPRHPEHSKMFEIKGNWLSVFWGGYSYDIELARIETPEDLLWWLHHIGSKGWEHVTGERVARLIESISGVRGWDMYGSRHKRGESPRPKKHKLKERGRMTPQVRYAVIRRDLHRCRACGFAVQDGAQLHVDHIKPVSKGGKTTMENLQTLCSACNLGKGAS